MGDKKQTRDREGIPDDERARAQQADKGRSDDHRPDRILGHQPIGPRDQKPDFQHLRAIGLIAVFDNEIALGGQGMAAQEIDGLVDAEKTVGDEHRGNKNEDGSDPEKQGGRMGVACRQSSVSLWAVSISARNWRARISARRARFAATRSASRPPMKMATPTAISVAPMTRDWILPELSPEK